MGTNVDVSLAQQATLLGPPQYHEEENKTGVACSADRSLGWERTSGRGFNNVDRRESDACQLAKDILDRPPSGLTNRSAFPPVLLIAVPWTSRVHHSARIFGQLEERLLIGWSRFQVQRMLGSS